MQMLQPRFRLQTRLVVLGVLDILAGVLDALFKGRAVELGDRHGFVRQDHVVPAYFFTDQDTRLDVDPLYNPDKYISVKNASWLQLDKQKIFVNAHKRDTETA